MIEPEKLTMRLRVIVAPGTIAWCSVILDRIYNLLMESAVLVVQVKWLLHTHATGEAPTIYTAHIGIWMFPGIARYAAPS